MESFSANNVLTSSVETERPGFQIYPFLKKKWVYHTLFWLLYYGVYLFVVVFSIYRVRDPIFYFQLAFFFPIDIALIYFNVYYLIPRFLYTRKYLYYGIALFLAILITSSLNILLQEFFIKMGSQLFALNASLGFARFAGVILERFYFVGFTMALKLAKDWIQNERRIKEMEKQYLESELNFLKSQIQPHFFFNTLNNLYSLTLKKSDEAPEVVLKLSELMSYMLYESNAPKVTLDKEIAYLENYLDLEKLRFGKRLTVNFEVNGETANVSIPPLILILFVENSFKHGVKNIANNITIDIELNIEGSYLSFSVTNPVGIFDATGTSGIGLKNVRRRLDLLYGKNCSLDIENREEKYHVSLKIPV